MKLAFIDEAENYTIDENGVLRRVSTGRPLKPKVDRHGRLRYGYMVNGIQVHKYTHRLVAEFFSDWYQDDMEVVFKDGNSLNCRIGNLELGPNPVYGVGVTKRYLTKYEPKEVKTFNEEEFIAECRAA